MKNSIHVSLFHCASSERRNLHTHCPDGPDSWCRYKQDKANNTSKYKPGPGLPDNIIKLVKPIYARLSSEDLLKKRLDGKTQNQNEFLNGMIWNRLPKSVFVGVDVLEFGAYDAVAHFNIGSMAATKIFNDLGLVPGQFFENGVGQVDKRRIMKAEHRNTPAVKKRRKTPAWKLEASKQAYLNDSFNASSDSETDYFDSREEISDEEMSFSRNLQATISSIHAICRSCYKL